MENSLYHAAYLLERPTGTTIEIYRGSRFTEYNNPTVAAVNRLRSLFPETHQYRIDEDGDIKERSYYSEKHYCFVERSPRQRKIYTLLEYRP